MNTISKHIIFKIIIIITLIVFITSCESRIKLLKKGINSQSLSEKDQIIKNLLEDAEIKYNNAEFDKAFDLYKKALLLEPKNKKLIEIITEISKWLPILKKQAKEYNEKIDHLKRNSDNQIKKIKRTAFKLHNSLKEEKQKTLDLRLKVESTNALLMAGVILADHDFEKARKLVKKAIMANPDSKEAHELWDKIAKVEDEWILMTKLKKSLKRQKEIANKRKQEIDALKAKSKKSSKKEDLPGYQSSSSDDVSDYTRSNEVYRGGKVDADKRLKRKVRTELHKIINREFPFTDVITDSKKVNKIKHDFFEEQSLIIFKKAIEDYEKDEKKGILQKFTDERLQFYQKTISEAYYWVGRYYEEVKNYDEALEFYLDLYDHFKESKKVNKFVYSIYLHRSLYRIGKMYMAKNDLKEAYKFFEKVIDIPYIKDHSGREELYDIGLNTEKYESYEYLVEESFVNLGDIRRLKNEFEIAITIFNDLKDHYSDNNDVVEKADRYIGDCYLDAKEYEKAYEIYSKIIELGHKSKQYEIALYKRAMTLIFQEKYNESRAELNFIKTSPLNVMKADSAYLYGLSYFKEKDYSKSIIYLNKAITDYPNFDNKDKYLLILGKAYSIMKVHDSAIEVFNDLINKFPNSLSVPEGLYEIAKVYVNIAKYDEARKALLDLSREYYKTDIAKTGKFFLADIYYNEKKYTRALKQYRIAYLSKSDGLIAFKSKFKLIKCLRKLDKFKLLYKFFMDAFDVTNLNRDIWDNEENKDRKEYIEFYYKILFEFGDFLIELKKYEQAVKVFKRVVKEYPEGENRLWSMYLIGKAYELNNDNEKAVKHYEDILNQNIEDFWTEQAKFNLNKLKWNDKYQNKAVEIRGAYSES